MNFTTRHTLTVGLTGGILCGKSAALAAWKKAGAFVLSCDELAREITIRPSVQKKIIASFGSADRKQLAARVFTEDGSRKQLEQILHPLIFKEIKKRLQRSAAKVRVVETPLLFELNLQKAFDITVAIVAPEKVLAARAGKRGMKKVDFLRRYRAQLPQEQKAAQADICIINDGTLARLTHKIQTLQQALYTLSDQK